MKVLLLCALALTAAAPTVPTEYTLRRFTLSPTEIIAIASAGTGTETVVIIPGMVGGAYSFRKVTPDLIAAGKRVVIVDLLGSGLSSKPSKADYSLTAQSRRVELVLDSLGVRNAVVIAHAVSGSVAYRLALHRPDQVRAIIGIDAGATERAGTSGLRKAMTFAPLFKLFGAKRILLGKLKGGIEDSTADRSWITEDVLKQYTANYREDAGQMLKVLQAMAGAPEPEPIIANLPNIQAKVYLMVGTAPADKVIGPEKIEQLRAGLKNLEIERVEGAGVFIQEEKPDAVVKAALRF